MVNPLRWLSGVLAGVAALVAATSCQGPPRPTPRPARDPAPLPAASIARSSYRGWDTIVLRNGLVEVQVAPQLGGRVVQYTLGDFGLLWVNERLAGRRPPARGVGPRGEWLNYGGDKLWLAPQGWEGGDQWPGPPDPVLDGGPHAGRIIQSAASPVSVRLTSPHDRRSGVQVTRLIKVFHGSSRVRFEMTLRNLDSRPHRWSIWQATQHDVGSRGGGPHDPNVWAYCPMNRRSRYPRGYRVMAGLAGAPSYQPVLEHRMMRVHYQRRVGQVGLDSTAGWLAVVHGSRGRVFVARFPYYRELIYPEGNSVAFWIHGVGQFVRGGKVVVLPDDPVATPSYLESGVFSPRILLWPGRSTSFEVDWYAARIGGNYPILDCTDAGVTCEPLRAVMRRGRLAVAGRFGVFYHGIVGLQFIDVLGKSLGLVNRGVEVSPAQPLVLSELPQLTRDVEVPRDTSKVAVVFFDAYEKVMAELARSQLEWFPIPPGALTAPLSRRPLDGGGPGR